MEPRLALRPSGQGSGAAVCIRLGPQAFLLGSFFLFFFLDSFINSPWLPSVLSTTFRIQFFFSSSLSLGPDHS